MTPREREAQAILAEADMVIANAILECKRQENLVARKKTPKARRKLEEARAKLYSLNDQRADIADRLRHALGETTETKRPPEDLHP